MFCLLFDNGMKDIEAVKMRMAGRIVPVPVEIIEFGSNKSLILANRAARTSQGWDHDPVGKTQRGDLEVRLRGLRESAELLYALGHQLLWTACAMFCGVFAWQASQHDEPRLARWAGGAGIAFLALLAGALLRGRRLRRRSRR